MIGSLGVPEILFIFILALLVFGPNRLPELARQVGGALRELKKIQQNIRADLNEMMHDESDGAAPPPTLPPKTDAIEAADGGESVGGSAPAPEADSEPAPPPEAGSEPAPPPEAD